MKTIKRKFGDFGESIAIKFLMKHGYVLIERNYLRPWGEVDLIVKKGSDYHFVQVKSAKVKDFESKLGVTHETYRSEDNIYEKKIKRMHRAIMTYCMENNINEDIIHIDAVIVKVASDFKRTRVLLLDNIVL